MMLLCFQEGKQRRQDEKHGRENPRAFLEEIGRARAHGLGERIAGEGGSETFLLGALQEDDDHQQKGREHQDEEENVIDNIESVHGGGEYDGACFICKARKRPTANGKNAIRGLLRGVAEELPQFFL